MKDRKRERKQKRAAAETIYHQTRLRLSSQADNFILPSIEIAGGDKKRRYSEGAWQSVGMGRGAVW